VQRLFATPNGRKSKQEYSIIIDIIKNSRNRIMFLWLGVHRNQFFEFRPEPDPTGTGKKFRPEPELIY
jgi:hypothetical protein